jgi:hypothetical protein
MDASEYANDDGTENKFQQKKRLNFQVRTGQMAQII